MIKNDDSLWCCGSNSYGQLGLNGYDSNAHSTFEQRTTDAKQVSCGVNNVMIVKNDGTLWAAGHGDDGQLGLPVANYYSGLVQVTTNINNDVEHVQCRDRHSYIIKKDGSLWATGRYEYGQLGLALLSSTEASNYINNYQQATVNMNNDIKQIICGDYHIFVLKHDNTLWGCGRSDSGQLGIGSLLSQNVLIYINV